MPSRSFPPFPVNFTRTSLRWKGGKQIKGVVNTAIGDGLPFENSPPEAVHPIDRLFPHLPPSSSNYGQPTSLAAQEEVGDSLKESP